MGIKNIGVNLWQIRTSVRVTGVAYPISVRERFCGTRAEAEARRVELISAAKKRSSSLIIQKDIKHFSDAVELYLDNLRAKGTLSRAHRQMIEQLCREFGHLPIMAVPDRLEAYRRALMGVRSSACINRHTNIIRAVFNRLVALERFPKNPISAVRFPRHKEKPRDRYFVADERERLFDTIDSRHPHILPIILYMCMVPCRVSELVTARREQYNRFTNTIYIPDSKAGIPIHKPVPEDMAEYFQAIPENCPWLFFERLKSGRYRPLTHLRYAWRDCLAEAGISDLRIHDLRHIAATDLYESGVPERIINEIAGWKTNMLSGYRHKDSLKAAQSIKFKKPDAALPRLRLLDKTAAG